MSVLTALREARKLLANEKNWTKDAMAKLDEKPVPIEEATDKASFCLVGAIHWCALSHKDFNITEAWLNSFGNQIANFNDHPDTAHKDILEYLDHLIFVNSDPSRFSWRIKYKPTRALILEGWDRP